MNASQVLQNMIQEADSTREKEEFSSASFKDIDGLGRIACYRDYSVRKNGYFAQVARTNWKLNGKVISAANLQAQFDN